MPSKLPAWQIWWRHIAPASSAMISSHASKIRARRIARYLNRRRTEPALELYTVRQAKP